MPTCQGPPATPRDFIPSLTHRKVCSDDQHEHHSSCMSLSASRFLGSLGNHVASFRYKRFANHPTCNMFLALLEDPCVCGLCRFLVLHSQLRVHHSHLFEAIQHRSTQNAMLCWYFLKTHACVDCVAFGCCTLSCVCINLICLKPDSTDPPKMQCLLGIS